MENHESGLKEAVKEGNVANVLNLWQDGGEPQKIARQDARLAGVLRLVQEQRGILVKGNHPKTVAQNLGHRAFVIRVCPEHGREDNLLGSSLRERKKWKGMVRNLEDSPGKKNMALGRPP